MSTASDSIIHFKLPTFDFLEIGIKIQFPSNPVTNVAVQGENLHPIASAESILMTIGGNNHQQSDNDAYRIAKEIMASKKN
jgi:hypothetical protein